MNAPRTTRVSTRGQVVIPQIVRERMGLREGDLLAVHGEGDTIVLQRIRRPTKDEIREMFEEGHAWARRKGIKRSDVMRAIREVRNENVRESGPRHKRPR